MVNRIRLTMDIFFTRKAKYITAALLAILCCCFMVIFPTVTLYSTQKSISLWASNVLPALLPFFICANFLNYIGIVRIIRPSLFPFVMSILSGYPMGAKIIGDMSRSGAITTGDAKRMISFCSTSGPTFMIGAVGVGMLGSASAGIVIAIAHYLGALLNGFIYSRVYTKETKEIVRVSSVRKTRNLLEIFTDAILSSFKSLSIILAYIVLFMFITDMIYMSGIFNFIPSAALRALARGFFEMTVGCGAFAECIGLSMTWKCVLSTAVLSWGGLSIIGQSMSMLSGSHISLSYFVLTKLTHCVFAGIIAFILASFML